VRERIAKGESFQAVAREVSDAPSAILGGDIGCVGSGYGFGADELKKAIESLKPGDLSPVVESPRGYHVLKVTGKLAADQVEHEGRAFVARKLYAHFAADEALNQFAAELIARAKNGEKLEDASRVLSADVAAKHAPKDAKKEGAEPAALLAPDRPRFEISAPFNANGNPLPDVDPTEPLAPKAFELKAADELYQKPLPTANGAVVMQLKERTEASHDEFIKEKPRFVQALLQDKSSEALVRYVGDLRRAAGEKLKVMSQFGDETKGRSGDEE